jgi:hypothetical protein
MRARHHVLMSTVVSAGLHAAFRSPALTVSSWLAGIFIDLDHIPDYIVQFGFRPDLKLFLHSFGSRVYKRIFIVLHSWELIFAMTAAVWLTGWNEIATGILIGFWHHMFFDQLINHPTALGYFMFWRIKNRFIPQKMFRKYGKSESDSVP